VYRGKQWIVIANPQSPGGGFVLHGNHTWFNVDDLGDHCPNSRKTSVEYSMYSHLAEKGFDLDELEAVYRSACIYFKVDTDGWLDHEIEHARAMRHYHDISSKVQEELFPTDPNADPFGDNIFSIEARHKQLEAVKAELTRRGIVNPEPDC
jgi:hypothetical protein